MRANKNWLTISLYIIAVILFIITFFHSLANKHTGMSGNIYFIGLIILFIAMLNTWGNRSRKYYVILMGISVLLFFLFIYFAVGVLVNIQSQYQIQGRWAEDMAWSIGGVFFAGFVAGIVGIFVCIARWR